MTPSDAVFVAKMIRTMHDLGTNGFTTVFAYMQVSFRCHNLGLKLTSSSSAIHLLLAYSLAQRVKLGILVCPI
jgi:hypothetical protein